MSDYTELQKAAAYAAQDTIKFADEDEEMRALQQFHEEVDPETILALIAENEHLTQSRNEAREDRNKIGDRYDQLKAENEALRKDKDRLDALESNFWDVRHDSHPIADTGDSSSSLEIVGHWMDKPFERVIGEDWNENLRAAIDQAMKAPAYPPARPEYPELDDIPDFTPGNGNSARRRAESLGIDYDAAMSKGEQS